VLLAEFAAWCRQHLRPTDQVVLEATLNTWQLYDQLVPLVASVTVANPLQVKLIATSRVKTDNRDTLVLARLLAAGRATVTQGEARSKGRAGTTGSGTLPNATADWVYCIDAPFVGPEG
jgi:transposase